MKVLFLTPRYPYKVDGGGLLKTKRMIDFLSNNCEVKVVSLGLGNETKSEEVNRIEYPLPFEVYSPSLVNLFKSYIKNIPLSLVRNYSKNLSDEISLLIDWADVVFVDHFIMFQYMPKEINKRVVLHQHNAEFKIWERTADKERNFFKKFALYLESFRIKKFEKSICNQSDLIFAAPNDKLALSELGISPSKIKITYHLGDDGLLNYPISNFSTLNNDVVFLGNLSWNPNIDGIFWFLNEVWSKVLLSRPCSNIYIIGNVSCEIKEKLESFSNVKVCGFVDDLNDVLSHCKVFISPLRFGSGMKVKNITALYKGMPIVTTTIGAEGIDLEDGKNAYITDDPDVFSDSVLNLFDNPVQCEYMARSARELGLSKYSWDDNLKHIYKGIKSER